MQLRIFSCEITSSRPRVNLIYMQLLKALVTQGGGGKGGGVENLIDPVSVKHIFTLYF